MHLPESGLSHDDVMERLAGLKSDDLDTHGGRTWAYVYDSGRESVDRVAADAYVASMDLNGLDPTVFPSMLMMERDITGIAATHLHGDEQVVGNFTSGGTESCMLAVKTARDHARTVKGIEQPQIVLPETAHAAFHKGAHYFGVEPVHVDVDPETFKVSAQAVAEAITDRTALVVVSAPSYAHGVIDPVAEIAAVCRERGVLLHVDACIGGWLLPFFERLGAEVTPFDFRVDGVTSMSMDFHKYAYCPKGASVVLYRDADLRRHQLYACASWTGYTVINPTIQSTKSGGPLAATWAILHHLGDGGYMDIARRTLEATRKIADGIGAIEGLEVLGTPEMSLIAFTADGFSVFEVTDRMKEKGWYIQPQLAYGSSPENIHLTVTATSLDRADALLADLADACEGARQHEPDPQFQQLLEAVAQFDPADFTPEMYANMLDMAGLSGDSELPENMAEINAILNALPAELREQLLTEFLNNLYRQPTQG